MQPYLRGQFDFIKFVTSLYNCPAHLFVGTIIVLHFVTEKPAEYNHYGDYHFLDLDLITLLKLLLV